MHRYSFINYLLRLRPAAGAFFVWKNMVLRQCMPAVFLVFVKIYVSPSCAVPQALFFSEKNNFFRPVPCRRRIFFLKNHISGKNNVQKTLKSANKCIFWKNKCWMSLGGISNRESWSRWSRLCDFYRCWLYWKKIRKYLLDVEVGWICWMYRGPMRKDDTKEWLAWVEKMQKQYWKKTREILFFAWIGLSS